MIERIKRGWLGTTGLEEQHKGDFSGSLLASYISGRVLEEPTAQIYQKGQTEKFTPPAKGPGKRRNRNLFGNTHSPEHQRESYPPPPTKSQWGWAGNWNSTHMWQQARVGVWVACCFCRGSVSRAHRGTFTITKQQRGLTKWCKEIPLYF